MRTVRTVLVVMGIRGRMVVVSNVEEAQPGIMMLSNYPCRQRERGKGAEKPLAEKHHNWSNRTGDSGRQERTRQIQSAFFRVPKAAEFRGAGCLKGLF
ncbi:MAG TPA: hypothetical protein VMN36_01875 [Verrucomicrobiales bacterium]|nr:hypothetical protein [Verrucomicrobiales bacterium]